MYTVQKASRCWHSKLEVTVVLVAREHSASIYIFQLAGLRYGWFHVSTVYVFIKLRISNKNKLLDFINDFSWAHKLKISEMYVCAFLPTLKAARSASYQCGTGSLSARTMSVSMTCSTPHFILVVSVCFH